MELLSNLRSQPKFQEPNSSTGSLGSATGSHKKGGAAGNSATSITDFWLHTYQSTMKYIQQYPYLIFLNSFYLGNYYLFIIQLRLAPISI